MSTALAHADHLPPIDLAELVERAALLTRVDRKYVVPVRSAAELVGSLPATTRVLDIDGRREFGYRSVYLDTPEHESYLVSGRSRRRRWKVRTRSYLDTGSTWLEVKTRVARGRTLKQRIAHPDAEETGGLTWSGATFVSGILSAEVAAAVRPALVTAYRRSTLYLPASDSRVTVDTELGWTALRNAADLDRPALAIVETKTGSTPSEADRLLWAHGHRPVRISKYGVGMAALDPALPALKWHRALHHHLHLPPRPRPAA